jgi:hypothetical protein
METLCKLYLELANVVPSDCISAREVALKKKYDRYGIALMMIAQGCGDHIEVARRALDDNA